MSKYKLSPWHDGSVKPVHVGVYETYVTSFPCETFQYWTGRRWGAWCTDKKEAAICKDEVSWFQSPKWRGILK